MQADVTAHRAMLDRANHANRTSAEQLTTLFREIENSRDSLRHAHGVIEQLRHEMELGNRQMTAHHENELELRGRLEAVEAACEGLQRVIAERDQEIADLRAQAGELQAQAELAARERDTEADTHSATQARYVHVQLSGVHARRAPRAVPPTCLRAGCQPFLRTCTASITG